MVFNLVMNKASNKTFVCDAVPLRAPYTLPSLSEEKGGAG